jgi:hypothetical protein
MTYGIGNPGSILGQAQKCGRIKLVYGIHLVITAVKVDTDTIYACHITSPFFAVTK